MIKKTKIIGTIGPVSSSYETLKELVNAGLNTVRLNMSHGSYEEQMEKVDVIRNINQELGTSVGILLDTKGPEVRTGTFKKDKVLLEKGNKVTITTDQVEGDENCFSVSYEGMANDLNPGNIILLDDGYVSVKVIEVKGNNIECEILNTGYMKDRRGVNVPGVTLNFEFMSEKDRSDIVWACENNFDYIAASFVRNKNDLKLIRDVIASTGNKRIQVISKVESQDAVDNIYDVIEGSDGIMVARGDLGVEVPAEEVPVVQKLIIKECNRLGKIVVTATQMLESMQSNPRPTRAEVSDVFNAVIDGTDCVMLSGETAGGDYPVEAVQTQATIAKRAESVFNYDSYTRNIHRNLDSSVASLVAFSAVSTADKLEEVKLIIAPTESGTTPRIISQMKPNTPVLALTQSEDIRRSLALCFGVYCANQESASSVDELIKSSVKTAKDLGYVSIGDFVVVVCGTPSTKGSTDLVNVVEVQ